MGYFFVIFALFLSSTLTKSLADVASLQDQYQDHLDPLQDQDQDLSINNQDKRTICNVFNKCGGSSAPTSSSYVKRLVIRGGLKQQIVGYAPILKPVGPKPVILGGYRYQKPKIHFMLKAPSSIHGGWRPVQTATKPVVEVVKPVNHVDVVHNNPVPHVDHVAPAPAPVHVDHVHVPPDHVHFQPVQPTFIHLKPVSAGVPHVDQIHQINVPHGGHYDTFTHIDHLQPVAQPIVPPTVVKPIAPSPVLFEVTRPNLGVLPLGAKFLTPVLKEAPHVHLTQVAPAVVPSPAVHHHHHPVQSPVQGIIHSPVGLPAIVPQPGVSVEYHGTRNYLPYVPQTHVHPQFAAVHPHQHLPSVAHATHNFAPQQALPFEHGSHGFASSQQLLPHNHVTQFVAPEQQLPHTTAHQFQQQLQAIQQYQDIPQGQLPLEGEHQQQSFDQFLASNPNALNIQNFEQGNVIQPGQTDVQIPYHLPQHGGAGGVWDGAQQGDESRGFTEQVFRPSQQLEAPYKK